MHLLKEFEIMETSAQPVIQDYGVAVRWLLLAEPNDGLACIIAANAMAVFKRLHHNTNLILMKFVD